MNIPKKFTINGQTINVEIVDELDSEYGNYSDAKELIRIARTIKEDKETIRLSQLQIENTFWHEVFHAFQCHSKGEYSEAEAASYAGMMTELIRSSNLKIIPDEVIGDDPFSIEEDSE